MYPNGEVPVGMLLTRPCAGKDACLMMPGTAAKFDRLVYLAQSEYGWTPVVSGSADAYRTLDMQWYYYRTLPQGIAATPGTSSHGGSFEGRESGAVDIGNYAQVGQDVFFDLARRAGFQPGYYDGTGGKPDEPWHIIDWSPWDTNGADMPLNQDDQNWLNGLGSSIIKQIRDALPKDVWAYMVPEIDANGKPTGKSYPAAGYLASDNALSHAIRSAGAGSVDVKALAEQLRVTLGPELVKALTEALAPKA